LIANDLRAPFGTIRSWFEVPTAGMSVPEAPVYEDEHPLPQPCEVRSAEKRDMSAPSRNSGAPQHLHHTKFRGRIAATSNSRHQFRARQPGECRSLRLSPTAPVRHAASE